MRITKPNPTISLIFSIAICHCNALRGSVAIKPLLLQNMQPRNRHMVYMQSANLSAGRVLSTTRKRRGLLRTRARAKSNLDEDKTQYTIDESVCPPTNTTMLRDIVQKHIDTLPKYLSSKPIAEYNRDAFNEALSFVKEFKERHDTKLFVDDDERVKVILDSGCGTGRSTRILGHRFPDCIVIGIDRSLVRLKRNKEYRSRMEGLGDEDKEEHNNPESSRYSNILLLRADLIDFWHLCLTSSAWQQMIQVRKHYLLYPNPYPKKARLKSRFYAHPAFPLLMLTLMGGNDNIGCDGLIVRSNWRGYLEEFALVVAVLEESSLNMNDFENAHEKSRRHSKKRWATNGPERITSGSIEPMTNFEAKYFSSGEQVYELEIKEVKE